MTDPDPVAQRLTDAGWEQGDLLPPLSVSVVFDPEHPHGRAARNAAKTERQRIGPEYVPHAVAVSPVKSNRFLVLASQTCDIVRNLDQEPNVVGIEAFETDNPRVIAEAEGNSPRYFLLNRDRRLVADARQIVLIEKPFLARLERMRGAPDEATRFQFARWLGRRFNRPALPDEVNTCVARPITSGLAALRVADEAAVVLLRRILEIRIGKLEGTPPYEVRLLFVVDEAGDRGAIVCGLAGLVADMNGWMGENARIVAWDAATLYEISAGDYLDTIPLYAEHLTFQGTAGDEAMPPQYG
jgi:hypothetical protein